MSVTTHGGSTLGVLARQEIRNYLRHKLFWFSAGLMVVSTTLSAVNVEASSGALNGIAAGALLGVLGLVTMYGLTRRSDRAADAAGAVAVPERVRTLALACAVVVPLTVAMIDWIVEVVIYQTHPPAPDTIPPGVSDAFIHAVQFGQGVMAAVGGPLLGLLLARYLPRRGTAALAAIALVVITILMQGNFDGGQPYRVFWVWTHFVGPMGWSGDRWTTIPGNPFLWVLYLAALCVLGIIAAVYHDPESDRPRLRRMAAVMTVLALGLGLLTLTVGFSEPIANPLLPGTPFGQ